MFCLKLIHSIWPFSSVEADNRFRTGALNHKSSHPQLDGSVVGVLVALLNATG